MENNGVPPPHQIPPHPPYSQMYGYPMDPQWAGQNQHMMYHHQMLAQQGYPLPPQAVPVAGGMESFPFSGLAGFGSASGNSPEAFLGPFPCVRVSGLPFECSMKDILAFFQGYVVIDILMHNENEAFVLFANAMDFQMALQRDRQTMGAQFVEVHPSQRSEYYAAIAEKQWKEKQKETDEAILNQTQSPPPELPPPEIPEPSAALEAQPPIGAQWSLGVAPGQTQQPTQPLPTQTLAGPPSDTRGKGPGVHSGRGGGRLGPGGVRRTGGGIQVGEHTGFLRMRGLPFSATKVEIVEFFKGYKIVIDSIVLTYRGDGRATGEGYIGFETPDDSKAAMALHRNTMGSRYIELFISNKDEHSRAFARFGGR